MAVFDKEQRTYLLPAPQGLETVKEPDVLEQIREQPETRRHSEDGDAEQDQSEDGHGKEQSKQAHHANTQVPHTLTEHNRPKGEEDHSKDTGHNGGGHRLLFPLWTLVQPDIVHHRVDLLVLLDLDGPQALDSVLGLGVVVSCVRVDLAHSQGQEREREELEHVLGGGTVCHGWEEGVLLCGGFGVGGGLDGANGSLDYYMENFSCRLAVSFELLNATHP